MFVPYRNLYLLAGAGVPPVQEEEPEDRANAVAEEANRLVALYVPPGRRAPGRAWTRPRPEAAPPALPVITERLRLFLRKPCNPHRRALDALLLAYASRRYPPAGMAGEAAADYASIGGLYPLSEEEVAAYAFYFWDWLYAPQERAAGLAYAERHLDPVDELPVFLEERTLMDLRADLYVLRDFSIEEWMKSYAQLLLSQGRAASRRLLVLLREFDPALHARAARELIEFLKRVLSAAAECRLSLEQETDMAEIIGELQEMGPPRVWDVSEYMPDRTEADLDEENRLLDEAAGVPFEVYPDLHPLDAPAAYNGAARDESELL